MGVPPTIYNSTHSRRQHKRKKKKKKMQLPESHPSVVSAPCSAELSDKGRLCDSFYFFSLAVLPLLLLLLLRYIHSLTPFGMLMNLHPASIDGETVYT
jgi:hypothetical protein